jgi:hypothetical protein
MCVSMCEQAYASTHTTFFVARLLTIQQITSLLSLYIWNVYTHNFYGITPLTVNAES